MVIVVFKQAKMLVCRLQIQRGFHLLFTQLFNHIYYVQLKLWFLNPSVSFKASYNASYKASQMFCFDYTVL